MVVVEEGASEGELSYEVVDDSSLLFEHFACADCSHDD